MGRRIRVDTHCGKFPAVLDVPVQVRERRIDSLWVFIQEIDNPLDPIFCQKSPTLAGFHVGEAVDDSQGVSGRVEELAIVVVISVPALGVFDSVRML